MDVIDEFKAAYRADRLVFFVGAGASRDSSAPMPGIFREWTSKLFLPQDPDLADERRRILEHTSVPGSYFDGIQPEVFYEHLLTICPNREVLALWRALSPNWLATQHAELKPNANHIALARYAVRTGLPVFTTNFDTLFESAAQSLGQPQPRVLLPGHKDEAEVAGTYAAGHCQPGRLHVFKVHGSIAVDGEERLDTLATTMTAITTRNRRVIAALAELCERYRLVLLGYSGSDLDYFPSLLSMRMAEPPFWFDPLRGNDHVTTLHLARLGAIAVPASPLNVLAELESLSPAPPAGPDYNVLLPKLASEMQVALTPGQKELLLGMCLHSVGFNAQARDLLSKRLNELKATLSAEHQILLLLTLSRVLDATSRYSEAAARAREALDRIRTAHGTLQSGRALSVRAIYHLEQATQQAIGPLIRFNDPRVDWQPSTTALVRSLLSGAWVALRLLWLCRALRRRLLSGGEANPMDVRAVHATNDHLLTMFGRIVSAAGRHAQRSGLSHMLVAAARFLQQWADRSGDFFSYAGAQKYIARLTGTSENDAIRTFQLLRDPLNFALARRDQASELLSRLDGSRADVDTAAQLFREGRQAAQLCGSAATELKAVAGLLACKAADVSPHELLSISQCIQGAGYESYCAFLGARSETI